MRRLVGIMLIIALVFVCVGGPAFAAKPVKDPSITIVETYTYDRAAGGEQKVALFTVKDYDGEVTADSNEGTPRVVKLNRVKHELWFQIGQDVTGETATITISAGTTTEEAVIPLEGGAGTNEPPQNTVPPRIEGTVEVGQTVTADFGDWNDEKPDSLVFTGEWLITDHEPIAATDGGTLTLASDWAGATLRLSVTATDEEGLTATAFSESHVIADSTPVPEAIDYVALGDSIATGTVVPGYIDPEVPYPVRFREYIESVEAGAEVILHDFSEDGDQSGDLLYKVRNDSGMRSALGEAEVITVSIGGNNLMSAAKYSFFGVTYYDFDRIDESKAEAGRAAFETDFPQLMAEMRTLNPNAQIIVMTIYNPFNKTSDADNYNMVETYLNRDDGKGINEVILAESDSGNDFEVADIHAAFDDGYADRKDEITYMYIEDKVWFFELRNPHPNDLGQGIITDAHEALYSPMGQ